MPRGFHSVIKFNVQILHCLERFLVAFGTETAQIHAGDEEAMAGERAGIEEGQNGCIED